MSGALMVAGTTSDAGKTTIVAGLCRSLARRGISVAPFKAQNMALNSAVTIDGNEIGRAQFMQAEAARVVPEVVMNPILLKPTSDVASQVVVMGQPVDSMDAATYHQHKPRLSDMVLDTLNDLRSRFDVVIVEGAGGAAEINLLANDIVNLPLALRAEIPAILVGDIDPGGVFAALYGTVALLPDELSQLIRGFVINKFRGDPALLLDGPDILEQRTGVPTLGVVPMLANLFLDEEDSMALRRPLMKPLSQVAGGSEPRLDVAVVALPSMSNFTDLDPLLLETFVDLRLVHSRSGLGRPDLIILPGSKSTIADLEWLREQGLADAIQAASTASDSPTSVLGICAGYQMLGEWIDDEVESRRGRVEGLGLLPTATVFEPTKVLARRQGADSDGHRVEGYQIHHGRVQTLTDEAERWFMLEGSENEGCTSGSIYGTTLHGLFVSDELRRAFLSKLGTGPLLSPSLGASQPSFKAVREAEFDRLADHLDAHLDMGAIDRLLGIW